MPPRQHALTRRCHNTVLSWARIILAGRVIGNSPVGRTPMSRADWRSPGAYEDLRSLDASGFAWEYLRRNADFLQERRKLERTARQGALDPAEVAAFTRRWACDFLSTAETSSPDSVLWAVHALPSVIALTRLPAELADLAFQLPPLLLDSSLVVDGAEHLVVHRGAAFRVHVDDNGV